MRAKSESQSRLASARVLALIGVGWLGLACEAAEPATQVGPRNLLVVAVDTLRADHLGVYGARDSNTPRIDAFAEGAIVFEHAVSHSSWTLPAFATILTSQYTSAHGCWDFDSRLAERFLTLPEFFRDAGFTTAGIASHVFFDARYGLQQGFDSFDAELAHWKDDPGWTPVTSPQVTERALRWLEARADSGAGPWLLWLHYFDPHVPYIAHERSETEPTPPEEERYRSEVGFIDRHVGRVFEALESHAFAADTAVVFVSDHGESFSEHPGVRRHGRSLYREELRVPLLIRVPGFEPRRVSTSVGSVDLLPTLLDLFDIPSDEPFEGRSLVAAMRGEPFTARPLLAELRLRERHSATGIVEGRYKLIQDHSKSATHLYDIANDPAESHDLASEQPEIVKALQTTMHQLITNARRKAAPIPTPPVPLTPQDLQHLEALGYLDPTP